VDNGIALEVVRLALSAFSLRDRIRVSARFGGSAMSRLAHMLVEGFPAGFVAEAAQSTKSMPKALIVRDGTSEATAIAFVMQRLMVRYMIYSETGAPEVDQHREEEADMPATVEKALLLCTHGCFVEPLYLDRVCELVDREIHALPVIGDDEFSVPRPATFATLQTGTLRRPSHGGERSVDMLARAVAGIFKEIAVPFKAKMDRYGSLDAAAARAAKRLQEPPTKRDGPLVSLRGSGSFETRGSWSSTVHLTGLEELDDAELVIDDEDLGLDIENSPSPFGKKPDAWALGFGRERV